MQREKSDTTAQGIAERWFDYGAILCWGLHGDVYLEAVKIVSKKANYQHLKFFTSHLMSFYGSSKTESKEEKEKIFEMIDDVLDASRLQWNELSQEERDQVWTNFIYGREHNLKGLKNET